MRSAGAEMGAPAMDDDLMMIGGYGWMGGGMWIWTVTAIVVVIFLVFIVGKLSKQ